MHQTPIQFPDSENSLSADSREATADDTESRASRFIGLASLVLIVNGILNVGFNGYHLSIVDEKKAHWLTTFREALTRQLQSRHPADTRRNKEEIERKVEQGVAKYEALLETYSVPLCVGGIVLGVVFLILGLGARPHPRLCVRLGVLLILLETLLYGLGFYLASGQLKGVRNEWHCRWIWQVLAQR